MSPLTLINKRHFLVFLVLAISVFYWFYTTAPYLLRPMVSSEDGYSRLASGVAWSSPITRYPINYVWPPLTPLIYSLPYLLYPHHQYISVRLTSWLLIFISCLIIGAIGYRLSKKKSVALISVSLALINPLLINLSTQTLSENIWLPLVGLSIFFLLGKTKADFFFTMLFWTLSQTVRYESWYLSPLLIFIYGVYHRNLQRAIYLAFSSAIFPLYWYAETVVNTSNTHFYLDEKLFQAKHGPPEIYFHLIPSIMVWVKALFNSISPPIIIIFLVSIFQFYKQRNHLYLLPIFIFVSLILQVFFATMEIFPGRYLALLPLTTLPLVATFLDDHFHPKKLLLIIGVLVIIDIISSPTRLKALSDILIPEQEEVGNFISSSKANCIIYIKSEASPRFDHSAFWYFSRQPMTKIVFYRTPNPYNQQLKLRADCYTIVIEKTYQHPLPGEKLPLAFGEPVFENKFFQVYEPPILKQKYGH